VQREWFSHCQHGQQPFFDNLKTLTMKSKLFAVPFFFLLLMASCKKETTVSTDGYTYYEVGFRANHADWRDTGFVVRTKNAAVIQAANAELAVPVAQRKIVFGRLANGDGGFNKNGSFSFNWHFVEDHWTLVDVTAEIYDGRAYSDVHLDPQYWQEQMTQYGSWSSYIRKKLPGKLTVGQ
jgi:hypothetical protein